MLDRAEQDKPGIYGSWCVWYKKWSREVGHHSKYHHLFVTDSRDFGSSRIDDMVAAKITPQDTGSEAIRDGLDGSDGGKFMALVPVCIFTLQSLVLWRFHFLLNVQH